MRWRVITVTDCGVSRSDSGRCVARRLARGVGASTFGGHGNPARARYGDGRQGYLFLRRPPLPMV